MNLNDMTPRNLCFKLACGGKNKNYTLHPAGFDNETIFSSVPGRLNAILGFEVSYQPLHKTVRDIILSWNEGDLRSYTDQIAELNVPNRNAVNNQCQRISDFQNFITLYPNASPRDIILYAFFNTTFQKTTKSSYSDRVYSQEGIYGIKLLDALCFGGFEGVCKINYDDLGHYFQKSKGFHALKFSYEKFQARYYPDLSNDESLSFDEESNQEDSLPREIKDFSDFIDYLIAGEDPNFIGTIDDLRK